MEGIPEGEVTERLVCSRDVSIREAIQKGISLEEYQLNQELHKSKSISQKQED